MIDIGMERYTNRARHESSVFLRSAFTVRTPLSASSLDCRCLGLLVLCTNLYSLQTLKEYCGLLSEGYSMPSKNGLRMLDDSNCTCVF